MKSTGHENSRDRRRFLRQAGIYLAATSAACMGCNTASAYGRFRSCALSAVDGYTIANDVFKETNKPEINNYFAESTNQIRIATGLNPSFAFVNEQGSGNAFAVSEDIVDYSSKDGTVLFGIKLLNEITTWPAPDKRDNVAAILAILAHEWGHIAQFAYRKTRPTAKPMELMADFIAGWYVAYARRSSAYYPGLLDSIFGNPDPTYSSPHPNGAMTVITSLGDTDFGSSHHHGTPRQRLEAYIKGVKYRSDNFSDVLKEGYFLFA